ncbi:hypothetical protein GF342_01160 [Candidatus Woesearchaeota archaeon]|nr:hypothetical protein [Candidatus Woesearchaeota archaeon]
MERTRRDGLLWTTALGSAIGLVALTADLALQRSVDSCYEAVQPYKTMVRTFLREPVVPSRSQEIPVTPVRNDGLGEYPYTFFNTSFDGYLVVGDAAQAEDVIGRCDIAIPSSRSRQ